MGNILVTGAAGFVGAALCEELRRRHMAFVPAVRRRTRASQFEHGELSADIDWYAALEGCDTVVHLAARVHQIHESGMDSLCAYRVANRDASVNLARQAALHGVSRFVYVSSIKVNGEFSPEKPFSATDTPAPQDAYGLSKWEAEQALTKIGRETGMSVAIVRPPLVYGPGVKANFLQLMRMVHRGMPLPLGKADAKRSFVGLDNLVDFLLLCISSPTAYGQVWMVSDQEDISVAELVHLIGKAMGRTSRLFGVPTGILYAAAKFLGREAVAARLFEPLQVDSRPATELLGWMPPLSLEQELQRTVSNFIHTSDS